MKNLSPEEIKDIVMRDLVERQFLATANFSPEIYSPNCTFTDEIDSYDYASFVKVVRRWKKRLVNWKGQLQLNFDASALRENGLIKHVSCTMPAGYTSAF